MLQIELKRLLKESIVIFTVLIALMIHILTTSKEALIPSIILEIFLLLFSSYTGWSMFERERQENATEYLLSMPVSRGRLFFIKFLPRLLGILLVLAAYMLMHHFYTFPSYLVPIQVAGIYVIFFLVSLAFSISLKNFIGALFVTAFITGGLVSLIQFKLDQLTPMQAILLAGLILIVFPLTFYIAFHRFDIRPTGSFNLRSIPIPLVLVAIVTAGIWLYGGTRYWNYYLAGNGDLFRSSCHDRKSQWLRTPIGEGEVTNFKGSFQALLEADGLLYGQIREGSGYCRPTRLVEVNLRNGAIGDLLKLEDGWNMYHDGYGYNGIIKDGYYYNLFFHSERRQFKILKIPIKRDVDEKQKVEEILVVGNFDKKGYYQMFHMIEEPLQFFFAGRKHLFRVYCPPGQSEFRVGEAIEIGEGYRRVSAWKNRIAVFTHKGMTIYEAGKEIKPLVHKEKIKKVKLRFGRLVSRRLLLRRSSQTFIFDMEDLSSKSVKMDQMPLYSNLSNGEAYFFFVKNDLMSYGRLQDGEVKILKKETVNFEGVRLFRTYPNGVVVHNINTYQLFNFNN